MAKSHEGQKANINLKSNKVHHYPFGQNRIKTLIKPVKQQSVIRILYISIEFPKLNLHPDFPEGCCFASQLLVNNKKGRAETLPFLFGFSIQSY